MTNDAIINILLVEDNPGDALLLEEMIAECRKPCVLEVAETLSSGLHLLREKRFDAVLVDLILPDSSGIETFRNIQARAPDLPAIVLTGFADEQLALQAISLGAQDYLIKGKIDSDLLVRSIRYAIERKRLEAAFKRLSRRTELILAAAGEGILGLDTEGTIIFLNNAAAGILGYSSEEIMGRNCRLMYHHSRPDGTAYPAEDCPIDATFRQGTDHYGEEVFWRKDGTSFPVDFTSRPLHEENKIAGAVVTFRDITERKRAEEALRESEERFRAAFQNAAIGRALTAIDGRFIKVNQLLCEMLGYSEQELLATGFESLTHPDDRAISREAAHSLLSGSKKIYRFEKRYIRRDGEAVWSLVSTFLFRTPLQEPLYFITDIQDITERKRAEDRIRRSKQLSDALNSLNSVMHSSVDVDVIMQTVVAKAAQAIEVDGSSIGLFEGDAFIMKHLYNMPQELKERCCSPAQARGLDYVKKAGDTIAVHDASLDERIDPSFWSGFGVRSMLVAPLMMRDQVIGALNFYCTTSRFAFGGEYLDFARKLSGSLSLALENARLFNEGRLLEEEMRQMAQHDTVTGLPNRRLFSEIINVELAQMRRHEKRMAVLFLDLDRFKEVNDTLGHEAGDKVLKAAALRLKGAMRASDTVARIGGDEFNVILSDIGRPEYAAEAAQKILNEIRKPFEIDGHELNISTSIGISIFPDDSDELDALLRYADMAMYHAKEKGRNNYQFYNPVINTRSVERMQFENSLRRAIDRSEFRLYFQPLVDVATNRMVSAEALLRWEHPEQGLLGPDHFLQTAEDIGFMQNIDEWVLQSAGRQIKNWSDRVGPLCVTVNISARELESHELIRRISDILDETGLPPDCLNIEITETAAMRNVENTIARLDELAFLGVRVSLDDFGTGISSLRHLKQLPVWKLKLDRSFVRDIVTNSGDRAVVKAVLLMAHTMDLKVVAEGVEGESQLKVLRALHCDEAQGFFFSRPVPADEFENLIIAGK